MLLLLKLLPFGFSWIELKLDNEIKLGATYWFQIFYTNDIHIIWAVIKTL